MSTSTRVPGAGRALRALAAAALLSVLLPGCRRKPDGVSRVPDAIRMAGLERAGPSSVLSWKAVPGAAEYGVTVVGEDGTKGLWVWTGPDTRVTYGIAELQGLRDDTAFIPIGLPARPVRSLRPGGHYRWMVVALDASGHALRISDVQHFTAPVPPAPPAARPAPRPGRTAEIPDIARALTSATASACDIVPRQRLAGLLGRDPGEGKRMATSCRYGNNVVLVTGPTAIFEGVRAMLHISPTMVKEIPGVGDGAYWMELPLGGQLTAKKGAAGASVTVMDSTLSKQRSLELAKALVAALLGGARPAPDPAGH